MEFNIAARYANLSEAAKCLHITQPALSKHIKTLEAEIGFELFDRTTLPMRLTPLGEQFLEYSCRLTSENERLQTFIQSARRGTVSAVSLCGLIDDATAPILHALAETLKKDDQGIRLAMVPYAAQNAFDRVRGGGLDLAIEPRSLLVDTSGLGIVPLVSERAFVVMEAANPLSGKDSFGVQDLPRMSFVTLRSNRDYGIAQHLRSICRRQGFMGDIPLRMVILPADTFDDALLYGLDGQFLLLPESLAVRYTISRDCGYVARPLIGEDTDYDVCAFYSLDASAPVMALVRALEENLAAE